MNVKLFFFFTSTTIFILSIISICCAPIINKLFYDFENWKSLNCGIYSDLETSNELELKDIENYRYLNNLCRRQKAMYNLEYASLIISGSLSFICFYLSLLLNLNIGKIFKNYTGLIGVISGVISFILTLVYVCYSGYIFNNDIAYGIISLNFLNKNHSIKKLFPNGAIYKWNNNQYISAYEEDFGDYSNYIKYKDLGDKRYNYMSELYKKFDSDDPCYISFNTKPSSYIYSCNYIFIEPYLSISNKYLYDSWLTTLVISCFILAFNICLIISGFLLFKDKKDEPEPVNVNTSQNIIQFSPKDKNKILNINTNNIVFNNVDN